MRKHLAVALVMGVVVWGTTPGFSQSWSIGANAGLSVVDGSPGFHLTPVAEYLFNRSMGIGTEFSANTQFSAPVLWYPYFKYYFNVRGSKLRPYANLGPLLTFHLSSSPSFGILLGGGLNIPIVGNLYLAPDFVLGPVFNVGGGTSAMVLQGWYWGIHTAGLLTRTYPGYTIFVYTFRAGIRVEL
ncbi:MAG: hypothetical protein H6Q30_377 [Bacteroidetes bacterium]|nr:hypothetical protein [Bacteroidota bacterium]